MSADDHERERERVLVSTTFAFGGITPRGSLDLMAGKIRFEREAGESERVLEFLFP